MQNWIINQTADLADSKTAAVIRPDPLMICGDSSAHTWRVKVLEKGRPVDLTGASVKFYAVRSDNVAVMVEGNVEGNTLEATLPSQAYAYEGGLTCYMRYSIDGQKVVTAALMYTTVRHGIPGQIVDPGNAIPSLDELLALAAELQPLVDALESITATAETLPSGSEATATAQYVDGKLSLSFGLPVGGTGGPGPIGPRGTVAYDFFYYNPEDGGLYQIRPKDMPEDAPTFFLQGGGLYFKAHPSGTPVWLGQLQVNLLGPYDETKQYHRLDWVTFNGGSFVALADTLGNPPTDTNYWVQVAWRGEKGQAGDGSGDMVKADYDADGDGIIDRAKSANKAVDSDKLGGQLPEHYATAESVSNLSAVAKSGSYNDLTDKPGIPSKASDVQAVALVDGKARADQISAPMKTVTGSYTLALADAGHRILANSASVMTITIPADSATEFPVGTEIEIVQKGDGVITVAGGNGVILESFDDKRSTAGRRAIIAIYKEESDRWVLGGMLA